MPDIIYNPFGVIHDWLRDLLVAAFGPQFAWLAELIMTVISVSVAVGVIPLIVMLQVYLERKVLALMQDRIGPNRVGPYGLFQTLADAVKLMSKEDIVPSQADKILFALAPILVLAASLMAWAIIPWGPGLAPTDLNVGVVFLLAMGGLPALGIIIAGWSSHNKYALLGGMRAAAQLVSYEVPGVLAAVVPVLLAGSMSLQDIVQAQLGYRWFLFYIPVGPLAFLLFLIAGIAEINRTPFDLSEAESELGAGFHTEYSGMRFALFFLAEYANAFAVSAIAATLFLGGWEGPILPPFVWFLIKTQVLVFVLFWIRSTLPRIRYDQLMYFAWKRLLPVSLVNIGLAGVAFNLFRQVFAR